MGGDRTPKGENTKWISTKKYQTVIAIGAIHCLISSSTRKQRIIYSTSKDGYKDIYK